MAHQRWMHHSLCTANDARSQQSWKVVRIFASGKKEKRNCNHSCHLSYSDLWPYFCGEGSENLIIVKPECSLRCVSSCGRNPEVLHSPFLRRNLNSADQEKCDCKDPQEGSVIITLTRRIGKSDELQACPSSLLCLLVVKLWIHLSWWEVSIQLTIYDARITVCPRLRVQDCLNDKIKCSFVFGNGEHWVIAIILKSHLIFLLGSVITRYTTAQPDPKQTAATVSLSFSSRDLRNWLKERRELEEERRTNGGGEQAVVACKTVIKRKRDSSEQSRP